MLTKKDKQEIQGMILDAVDAVLIGIEKMGYAKQEDLGRVENKIDTLNSKVDTNYRDLKDKIDNVNADLTINDLRTTKLEKKLQN